MAEWAVVLWSFIRSCFDTNMFNSILIRVKITIFYNCVLDIKDTFEYSFCVFLRSYYIKGHKWFFQYVVVNLWCWTSTIMPEASQKVAETAEITKTAPQTQP